MGDLRKQCVIYYQRVSHKIMDVKSQQHTNATIVLECMSLKPVTGIKLEFR
jgi:hypothetical protein